MIQNYYFGARVFYPMLLELLILRFKNYKILFIKNKIISTKLSELAIFDYKDARIIFIILKSASAFSNSLMH